MWRYLLATLAGLAVAPELARDVRPRAAAAVAVARASMVLEHGPAPSPAPAPACVCGGTCKGGIWKPDGRIEQRCACQCKRCLAERAGRPAAPCLGGSCRQR